MYGCDADKAGARGVLEVVRPDKWQWKQGAVGQLYVAVGSSPLLKQKPISIHNAAENLIKVHMADSLCPNDGP